MSEAFASPYVRAVLEGLILPKQNMTWRKVALNWPITLLAVLHVADLCMTSFYTFSECECYNYHRERLLGFFRRTKCGHEG